MDVLVKSFSIVLILLCTLASCVEKKVSCEPRKGYCGDTPNKNLPSTSIFNERRSINREEVRFDELSEFIHRTVDRVYYNDKLGIFRKEESFSHGDSCHRSLANKHRFSDSLAFFIKELSNSQRVQLQGVASLYGMSRDDKNYFPISLVSHPLCRVTSVSLADTLGYKKVPGARTIDLMNRFRREYNSYRQKYLKKDPRSLKAIEQLWGKFFGCLAYSESLSTADTRESERVARKYAPSNYRRPAGVKFFEDPLQPTISRLNIGLYQFTPSFSGNINPCIRQWNRDYSSCSLSFRKNKEMVGLIGSSLQHFNVYCGVHKILQTFSVQVNSQKKRSTHPDNFLRSGFKGARYRCVTPHFLAGRAYNHFGPLQNTTGSNLRNLMKCIYP